MGEDVNAENAQAEGNRRKIEEVLAQLYQLELALWYDQHRNSLTNSNGGSSEFKFD